MQDALRTVIRQSLGEEIALGVELRPVPAHAEGDIALTCFSLAKALRQSPVAILQQVQTALEPLPWVEKLDAQGPYLNITCSAAWYFAQVLSTPVASQQFSGRHIVLEFSSPNTNKPLHLGHMRNNALGDSLVHLLRANGAAVTAVSIINDRGTHICKSMLAYEIAGDGATPASTGRKPDHLVGDYYVLFSTLKDEGRLTDEGAQAMLQAWEAGDKSVRALWELMNGWVYEGWNKTYARQGVTFDKWYYESAHYEDGKQLVADGLRRGVFTTLADGAIAADLTADGYDQKIVQRADGTSIYITQDLALAVARYNEWHPDELIYITDYRQAYHFEVLFLLLEKLGLLSREHLTHIGYGTMELTTGKMSSRTGHVVHADDLMDELSALAREEILARHDDWDAQQVSLTAEQIMNAAWKYYILSVTPERNMVYDAAASVRFEGATGPYIQYAGVRIRRLLEKSGGYDATTAPVLGGEERALGALILQWGAVLESAGRDRNPTTVATYILELAQEWSRYYSSVRILDAAEPVRSSRLQLAEKTLEVLVAGLSILGIPVPEAM
ncbi:arginine--tRNA ligase [Candidatus Peribacteria bacterium]|nr:arginine--tRNA ligase [Candidatus Peribacteria bacterium]